MKKRKTYVLAVAGSDSSGGAGIQADIKTIAALDAHALTSITAVTAQNSSGLSALHRIPAEFIFRQIETVVRDEYPQAVKVGMLLTGEAVRSVTEAVVRLGLKNVVVDPVIRASAGGMLLEPDAVPILKKVLFPVARVITPNLDEAEILTGMKVRDLKDMEAASRILRSMGPDVVITGGHLDGPCIDLLYDGRGVHLFQSDRIATQYTHGTGCVFSSALAVFLARGLELEDATGKAHRFVRRGIEIGYACGRTGGVVGLEPES